MRKTTSVNKTKPRANTIANRKNLNSSNQNSILNYVNSKPSSSSSNSRITRQNKRQTYCDNSDENIKQENSRQTKNAKFEAEQFLEIDRCFKTVEAGRRNDAEKLIPDSLEDLASDNEEDKKLGELGREIDCLVSSDHLSFDNFVTVFCYVFQTKPSNLKINHSDDLIEIMYTLMEEEKPVENAKDIWTILHENIYSFFDCFVFINFTHWNNQQLISLFCLLCRIYFDKQIINCRYLISNSFKLLIKQLFSADVDRLNSILNEFLNKKLLQCVDENIGRTFELFTLFAQFENKRNINDKMIDMWSRSLHRIREVLQNMRNNATTLNNLTDFKLLEKQQKWQPKIINITSDSIWSTSSDDEDGEDK
uniref:Uncharacterized protein n=1 Tax=Meloidogyne javanica TaxID=6303 RepID=A0A915LVL2_MELJA